MSALLHELNLLLHNPDDELPVEQAVRRELGIPEPKPVEVSAPIEPAEPELDPEQAIVAEIEPEAPEFAEKLRGGRPTYRKALVRAAIYKSGHNKFDLNIKQMPEDFQTGVSDYIKHIINNRGFSMWTLHAYKIAMGWFFQWSIKRRSEDPNFNPMAMELKDADSFKLWLIEDEDVSPLYTNNIILALKSLYSFLFIREYITRNTFAHLEIIKERIAEMRNPPTRGQVMEIINRFADSDPKKLIFTLAYFSGLRRSELAVVQRSAFTAEKVNDREVIYIKVLGKGKRERTVLVYDPDGIALLDKLIKANEHADDQPLVGYHVDYISHIVDKESSTPDANKSFTTHSMRHGYATNLRNLGVPIDTIARFLGHSNLTTTQIYMHTTKEDATKEVLSKL
jgi:site-specific recombinase XerD